MSFLIFILLIIRECLGVSNISDLEGRIVKGYEVPIERFPYSVFLHFKTSIPSSCGSSLISDQAVVTSARCLDEIKKKGGKITAHLGATYPKDANIKRDIILYTIHPKFKPRKPKSRFNLALALFDEPVDLKIVPKIPLSTINPEVEEVLFTAGWGKDKPFKLPDISTFRHLKYSRQMLMSDRECSEVSGFKKTPNLYCTDALRGEHYHGDLGNGLVNSKRHLVGVINYIVNDMTVYSSVMREKRWLDGALDYLFYELCLIEQKKERLKPKTTAKPKPKTTAKPKPKTTKKPKPKTTKKPKQKKTAKPKPKTTKKPKQKKG